MSLYIYIYICIHIIIIIVMITLGDADVVLAAVRTSGAALEYASEELRGDKDRVLC